MSKACLNISGLDSTARYWLGDGESRLLIQYLADRTISTCQQYFASVLSPGTSRAAVWRGGSADARESRCSGGHTETDIVMKNHLDILTLLLLLKRVE